MQMNPFESAQLEAIDTALALAVHVVAESEHNLKEGLELAAGHERLGGGDQGLGLLLRFVQYEMKTEKCGMWKVRAEPAPGDPESHRMNPCERGA